MTYQFLFTNNAKTTLAVAISTAATTIQFAPGTGSLFPNPGAGQAFVMTLLPAVGGVANEIVYCTARSADTLTVVRGQEGTAAQTWSAGDNAQGLPTAGVMGGFAQIASLLAAQSLETDGYQGLPGGLIVQWGQASLATGNGDVVDLPIAFQNAILGVVASDYSAACHSTGWATNGSSLTSFRAYGMAPGSSSPASTKFGYIAFGY